MSINKQRKNDREMQDLMEIVVRVLSEIRMYDTRGESILRFLLWVLTYYIGIRYYYINKTPFGAIPNYILLSGSYALDYYNKFSQDKLEGYQVISRVLNAIQFILILVLFFMSIIQLVDYSIYERIFEEWYFTLMIRLTIFLCAKHLFDLFTSLVFSDSFKEDKEQCQIDKSLTPCPFLDSRYEEELKKTATSGALTNQIKGDSL